MNLESFLNYRSHCVCGHELVLDAVTDKFSFQKTNDSLELMLNKSKFLTLNFDETLQQHKNHSQFNFPNASILLLKKCPICFRNQGPPRRFGQSTMIEMMYNQYYHYVAIIPNLKTKEYYLQENCEFISLLQDDCLYHTETSFILDKTQVCCGRNISGMFSQTIPRLNNQTVKSKDEFVSKIKMLIAFS